MISSNEVRSFTSKTLASKQPGLSGADWIGAYPQEGLTLPSGEVADTVMGQLVALRGRTVEAATETREGMVELATETEVQAGTTGILVPTAARLKAELDRRAALKSQMGAIDDGPAIFNNINVGASTILSGDLRGVGGVPLDARGVYATFYASGQSTATQVAISSADVTPGGSLRLGGLTQGVNSVTAPVPLGIGTNTGKVAVRGLSGTTVGFYAWLNGWWR